ncbi:polysaccharide biosynthesis/export family protein [Hydrogenophaga sp. MI9]|uniref:polysaccharide biosynthesis/export family protein n=1 Tax=Hydrogenophaga sp. MI9 TaxID=3453719 RepID=UPI003EED88BC
MKRLLLRGGKALLGAAVLCTATWAMAQQDGTRPSPSGSLQSPTAITGSSGLRPNGDPAPLSSLASVGADYRISPNDLLEFNVFGIPDMKRDIRVNASGLVSLPLIGPVQIAGLTAQMAEQLIASKYSEKYLQDPQVSLFIKEFTTQRITIEGAVTKPGIYPVTGQLTLLRALALAGGGAQYADLNDIMLYRQFPDGKRASFKFDLEKVRAGEVEDPDVRADDVIVVKRDPRRAGLRDSLFRDIIDTLNPFSSRY